MNDPQIRQLLFSKLADRADFSDDQLLEEAPLSNGSVRADVVVCSARLECFEIKSRTDTLKRLIPQAIQYEQSFDYVTLLCASNHLDAATEVLPRWWGIIEVTHAGVLKARSKARLNPYVNAYGMVDLLANEESREILRSLGLGKGVGSLSHTKLQERLERAFTIAELRPLIIDQLKARKSAWKPSELAVGFSSRQAITDHSNART